VLHSKTLSQKIKKKKEGKKKRGRRREGGREGGGKRKMLKLKGDTKYAIGYKSLEY
jgi:hypothetical protein